jgi:hypothetical protein
MPILGGCGAMNELTKGTNGVVRWMKFEKLGDTTSI